MIPHFLRDRFIQYGSRRRAASGGLLCLLLLSQLSGCARTPEGLTARRENQLLVEIEFADVIDPGSFQYFFAIGTDPAASPGPVPVVAPPWGNGWGAGNIDYVVRLFNLSPTAPTLFRVVGENLLNYEEFNEALLSSVPLGPTSQTLSFSLDLNLLRKPDGTLPDTLRFNIIATDVVPYNSTNPVRKQVDFLGSGGDALEINVRENGRTYQNRDSLTPEPGGDVLIPSIDITDWRIEVQRSD